MDEKTSVDRMALKLRRIVRRKSQYSLAREIGRSQPWLNRVENGKPGSVITDLDLSRLASALGVPVSYLEER